MFPKTQSRRREFADWRANLRRKAERRRLRFESLEGRQMLDATSPWTASANLTLSFAPDGTEVSSLSSSLYSQLGQTASQSAWQGAILRAFQTWAVYSNINIGLTADKGLPFGISGPSQGDPRFGDIRIGAIRLSSDEVAAAVDHNQILSGTWAGDVVFNSATTFASVDEIFSVALHEAGHVLGLSHSTDPASPMFSHAISTNVVPTPQDIANLRAIYGGRSLDANEGSNGNDSLARATTLRNRGSLHGTIPLVAFGDISRSNDGDYFALPPLSNYQGPITFTVRTDGISLLAPRLAVFNETGERVGQAESISRRGSTISVTIPSALEGEKYFARVTSARTDVFSVGSYALIATLDDNLTVPKAKIRAVTQGDYRFLTQDQLQEVFLSNQKPNFNDDAGLNDEPLGATHLLTAPGYASNTHYRYEGSIALATESDYYVVKSPRVGNVMTVTVTALEQGGLIPDVHVFDKDLNAVAAELLVNGNGEYVLQVPAIQGNADYFVEVVAWNPAGTHATGNYRLDVGFRRDAIVRETFAKGSFAGSEREKFHSLYIAQNQLFHIALDASPTTNVSVVLWTTIYNEDGDVVYRVATVPGRLNSTRSVILAAGSYLVQVTAATDSTDPLPTIDYELLGLGISGPIGPRVVDANGTPIYTCPDGSGKFCYPGGLVTTKPFIFVDGGLVPLPAGSTTKPPVVSIEWWYWYPNWLTKTVPK